MCATCDYRRICKYKMSLDIFRKEIAEMQEDYSLPLIEVDVLCKCFKEEDF